MKGHESFLQGIKPAFLCSHRYEPDELDTLLSQDYPRILYYELEDFDKPGEIFDRGTLFFQDEPMKVKYLDDAKDLVKNSREEIILLGQVLGFPPIACEFYVDCMNYKELQEKRAGYRYYGRVFAGNIDDSFSIAKWLWDNVQAPIKPVEITYKDSTLLIDPTASVVAT